MDALRLYEEFKMTYKEQEQLKDILESLVLLSTDNLNQVTYDNLMNKIQGLFDE